MTPTGTSDVVVVGGGLIGAACALAIARRGASVRLITDGRPGIASTAAAGIFAPSIEQPDGLAREFGFAARDRYPSFLDELAEATGVRVPVNREGVLQVAVSRAGVRGLRRAQPVTSQWLSAKELTAIEPSLSHALGAVLHPYDGAVDNVLLLETMLLAISRNPSITVEPEGVSEIGFAGAATARTARGDAFSGDTIVLAAGAWTPLIAGLPRALPIEPIRGQMLSYVGTPTRRVVFGPTGYIVPRNNGMTAVGSTSEHVGFDASTTPAGAERIANAAKEIWPEFARSQPQGHWSGLRPITPDMLPIIGRDPDQPGLLYACGHSRNGVLMAPLTGDCVASLVSGQPLSISIAPFAVDRFRTATNA
jgi:glycine oxidase